MKNSKNSKSLEEVNYCRQTAIVKKKIRKNALFAFVFTAAVGVWFFAGTQGAEAANRYRVGTGDWNTTASITDSNIGPGG